MSIARWRESPFHLFITLTKHTLVNYKTLFVISAPEGLEWERGREREREKNIPKHVIGMRAGAGPLERPGEGVLVLGGVPEVVELVGVPLDLERHLRHADGVAGGAGGRVGEPLAGDGVEHVVLVVGAV